MKTRHAAALALVGWYLMVPSASFAAGGSKASSGQDRHDSQVRDDINHEWYEMCPPLDDKTARVAVTAPFTQWEIEAHWPNRDLCEQERAGAARIAKDGTSDVAVAFEHCRCFSSNDPRLDQTVVRQYKREGLEQLYRKGFLKTPPK